MNLPIRYKSELDARDSQPLAASPREIDVQNP